MYKLIREITFLIIFPIAFIIAIAYRNKINIKEWHKSYCENYDLGYFVHSNKNKYNKYLK